MANARISASLLAPGQPVSFPLHPVILPIDFDRPAGILGALNREREVFMKRIVLAGAIATCFSTAAAAQDTARAILVLDGSGSMWGQIDGKAKITIAQEVVGDLLGTLPDTTELGLTVYGHRRKGDCSDIETIVAPSSGSRDSIAAAVNGVKPKGKTPMTDAVKQAAEALRFTEEKATVILVSDGIETCAPDPCAAARALEEAGVDFTAHVVGFDITDPEALAQMQCLAEETGGTFRSAGNAAELGAALAVVAEPAPPAPEPVPDPVTVTFRATDGKRGPVIGDGLTWTVMSGSDTLAEHAETGSVSEELAKGEYRATVLRAIDGATGEAVFGVGSVDKLVEIELPEYRPAATIEAAETAIAGSTIPVRWTGPDAQRDYIAIGEVGSDQYLHYTYTEQGPLLDLKMPPEPGSYEIRYMLNEGPKVLATHPITLTAVEASVTPPATAAAGGTISVDWTGPDYDNDYVTVSIPGEDGYLFYAYTRKGSPAEIKLPSEPGQYEVRYVLADGATTLTSAAFEVTEVGASFTAPEEMLAGSTVDIAWTGPDNEGDYIAIAERGDESGYLFYAYTRNGSPAQLSLPATAGEYDLVYVMASDNTRLARMPVTVTETNATLAAPADLPAGAIAPIDWTGPDNKRDFIAIRETGDEGGYLQYAYTERGAPAELQLPATPGEYEIVYYLDVDRHAIATIPVTVRPVSASVEAPDELTAGSQVLIDWTGPNYDRDYVAVTERGEESGYITYAYTRNGNPVMLQIPDAPGEYDVVYILASENKVIARKPVTVQ